MNKFDKTHMESAVLWSKMSYCKRGQVGAIISLKDRTTVPSYNGTISGMKNECEDMCLSCKGSGLKYSNLGSMDPDEDDIDNLCTECRGKGIVTNNFTLHAEANAITHAANSGLSLNGSTIYITKSPCKECSKLIAQSGIVRVVYKEEYHDTSGIDFLKSIPNMIVEKYNC